jgi:hypothetical protein
MLMRIVDCNSVFDSQLSQEHKDKTQLLLTKHIGHVSVIDHLQPTGSLMFYLAPKELTEDGIAAWKKALSDGLPQVLRELDVPNCSYRIAISEEHVIAKAQPDADTPKPVTA